MSQDLAEVTDIAYYCRFKCIDLDGNGILTRNELQFFYEEQLHRMECMAQEPVLFEDILCQIIDMIGPEVLRSVPLFFLIFFIIKEALIQHSENIKGLSYIFFHLLRFDI